MSDLVAPETPAEAEATARLVDLARSLRAAAVDVPLTPAERSYLGSTAARLDAMADRLRAEAEPAPEPVRRPETFYTRTEAARGLLTPRRDYRGWRVYSRDDLARALALASHVPVDLAGHGRERRG